MNLIVKNHPHLRSIFKKRLVTYLLTLFIPCVLTIMEKLIFKGEYRLLIDIIFFMSILLVLFYYILYQRELVNISIKRENQLSKVHIAIFMNFLFLIISFSVYMFCLENYNPGSFSYRNSTPTYFEMLFYSFGIFIMNSQFQLDLMNYQSHIIVLIEQSISFISIIILFDLLRKKYK